MADNTFKITCLKDGRIKIETGNMGDEAQHTSAEGFLAAMITLSGASKLDVTYEGKPAEDRHHTHGDGTAHSHG